MARAFSMLTGLIGGLIATLICVALRAFWLKVVLPWYEEHIYVDAHVEGRWQSSFTVDGIEREGVMDIRRLGHSITGTLTMLTGPHAGSTYEFSGTFRNLIMTATYLSADQRALDRGTFTLMLIENGDTLTGFLGYYSNANHCVGSVECKCTRLRNGITAMSAAESGRPLNPNKAIEGAAAMNAAAPTSTSADDRALRP